MGGGTGPHGSDPLAARTIVCPALSKYDSPDECAATQARLPGTTIYGVQLLECSRVAAPVDMVGDGRSAMLNREL